LTNATTIWKIYCYTLPRSSFFEEDLPNSKPPSLPPHNITSEPVTALPGPNGRSRLPGTRLGRARRLLRRSGLGVVAVVARFVGNIDAVASVGAVGVVVAGRREVRVVDTVAKLGWRTVGVGQAGCRGSFAGGREGRRVTRRRRNNRQRGSRRAPHRQDRNLVHAITIRGTT
jgi:hypothetical protein